MFAPEAKRRGLLQTIQEQLLACNTPDTKIPATEVEVLIGRLGHTAQVAPEANPALGEMYRAFRSARRAISKPKKGSKTTAARDRKPRAQFNLNAAKNTGYKNALEWWAQALQKGVFTPLMPCIAFPHTTERGCCTLYSDAARELGTGRGGFSPVHFKEKQKPTFLYTSQTWPEDIRQDLIDNVISMPAGELFGLVVITLTVIKRLENASHMILYTDSDAAAIAINRNSSSSKQMDFLLQKLQQELGTIQLLAVHIPGVRNGVSDDLSRNGTQKAKAEATKAGFEIEELPVPEQYSDWMREAAKLPQH